MRGRVVRRLLREKILEFWPNAKEYNFLGFGYAMPYMRPYMNDAQRIINAIPSQLGGHAWPMEDENLVCVSHENNLPFETNSIDMILVIHSLEFLDNPEKTFEELWRALKSSGRIIVVVPNRMGLWARMDNSPFGQGQPYSAGQVEQFLKSNLFVHERTEHALFMPPITKPLFLHGANIFEKIGRYIFPALGGVHIIEASKQLYAGRGKTSPAYTNLGKRKQLATRPVTNQRKKAKL